MPENARIWCGVGLIPLGEIFNFLRQLVRDASEGRFGRCVPGYADWYVTPPRVILPGVYQGTPIGT